MRSNTGWVSAVELPIAGWARFSAGDSIGHVDETIGRLAVECLGRAGGPCVIDTTIRRNLTGELWAEVE